MGRRRKMPTRTIIAEYWMKSPPFDFGLAGVSSGFMDDELVADECWACGDVLRLQRCHIVSVEDGGDDNPSNLTILCNACHVESEHLKPDIFPVWLRNKRAHDWMQPWMHSKRRFNKAGYTDDHIRKLLSDKSPEEVATILFSKMYGEIYGL